MGYVVGFLPWIVYWILVGNVPFRLAESIAFGVAVATALVQRARRQPLGSLEVGSLVVFALLLVAAFVLNDAFLERWIQPLSNVGILLVALGGLVVGRPFVRDYAEASVDEATARSDGFRVITRDMTVLWVVAFAGMTVSSMIPPLVQGDATIRDAGSALSVVCYWVVPYALLAVAGLASATFPSWFEKRSALVDARSRDLPPVSATSPAPPVEADVATGGLRLDLPPTSRHDEPFRIVATGAPAGTTLEISASGADLYGRMWRSRARFAVLDSGPVDTSAAGPVSGDWSAPGLAAPLAAMRFDTPDAAPELFVPPADGWRVTVEAALAGRRAMARRTITRHAADDGVRLAPAAVDSRPGLLALPPGAPPAGGWPAVVCFGGSEGGFESQIGHAALLASHGYAALAATWVEECDGAVTIASIPLERFRAAASWLAARDDVDAARVVAMAVSRGAEGLLAGATRPGGPALRGLVLVSPSSVTWQAIGADGEIAETPSWTFDGQPVPWLPVQTGALMPQLVRNAWRVRRDIVRHHPTLLRLRPAYEASLASVDGALADPAIAAERVAAPLLLLTGGADDVWPSEAMAAALLARRNGSVDEHVGFADAGHLIRLGAFPTDAPWTGGILLGGTRDGQAAAQEGATRRVLAFLERLVA